MVNNELTPPTGNSNSNSNNPTNNTPHYTHKQHTHKQVRQEPTMANYQITLRDGVRENITEADAYCQEGTMTTFFKTSTDRRVIDSWSTRLASFRTTEVMTIKRCL